nr:hypothetical protein CFP56_76431 [Quercus suber]
MPGDMDFLNTVKAELRNLPISQILTWHQHSRDVLMPLLNRLQPAQLLTDLHDPEADGLKLSNAEVTGILEDSEHIPIPIFAHNRQYHPPRPHMTIEKLLADEHYDTAVSLDVQIASDAPGSDPQSKTIAQIRRRFAEKEAKADPWNILGPSKPGECSLPEFLDAENCCLLPDVTQRAIDFAGRAGEDEKEDADEDVEIWKQSLSWFLLAEAGALTTTHQDALGLSTWISCQQGQIGFAWLSRPSEEQTRRWQTDPDWFQGGNWRFKVLRPGETVYFDPGLIHFVFRKRGNDGQTLAFGGHSFRRAIAGTWARLLDEHIALVTTKDLIAPETREAPFPWNEDVSYVLRYGMELLEAVENHLKGGLALTSKEANLFKKYHRRLFARFRSLRRVEEALKTADDVRQSYADADREALEQSSRQQRAANEIELAVRSTSVAKRRRVDSITDASATSATPSLDAVRQSRSRAPKKARADQGAMVASDDPSFPIGAQTFTHGQHRQGSSINEGRRNPPRNSRHRGMIRD